MKWSPITRPSLLVRVRNQNDAASWGEFVELYTPLVYGFCRQRGLQEADAADVTQEVMRAVHRAMARFEYDPARGSFRNWLLTVVRSKYQDFLSEQRRRPELASATTLARESDRVARLNDAPAWDAAYYQHLFQWAVGRVRCEFQDSTWHAFWGTAVEARDGKEVAHALGLSIGAVYVAKSRVLARLREEVRAADEEGIVRFLPTPS